MKKQVKLIKAKKMGEMVYLFNATPRSGKEICEAQNLKFISETLCVGNEQKDGSRTSSKQGSVRKKA